MGTSIKEVMTRDVRACEPNATVADAAKVMAQEDVGPVPIVEEGRLVGIVTDRDIVVRVVAEGRDPEAALRHVVSAFDERALRELDEQALQARFRVEVDTRLRSLHRTGVPQHVFGTAEAGLERLAE